MGSGYISTSQIIFQVPDTAGQYPLAGQNVLLHATTRLAGGLTLDGHQADVTKPSDVNTGQISVLINSGTVPTPVRVSATLVARPSITTVSSKSFDRSGLAVATQLLISQGTRNIEGFDIDGTKNTYNIIASDRLGNPVPAGTSINFIAEGGQVVQSALTTIDSERSCQSYCELHLVFAPPLPMVVSPCSPTRSARSPSSTSTALNVYAAGDPLQDLGNIYLDRYFNGVYNANDDQFIIDIKLVRFKRHFLPAQPIPAAYRLCWLWMSSIPLDPWHL